MEEEVEEEGTRNKKKKIRGNFPYMTYYLWDYVNLTVIEVPMSRIFL
jgi:hypothetical protein